MLLAMGSMSLEEQDILNKVSLSQNTHNARLYMDWLMQMWWEACKEPNSVFPLGTVVFANSMSI